MNYANKSKQFSVNGKLNEHALLNQTDHIVIDWFLRFLSLVSRVPFFIFCLLTSLLLHLPTSFHILFWLSIYHFSDVSKDHVFRVSIYCYKHHFSFYIEDPYNIFALSIFRLVIIFDILLLQSKFLFYFVRILAHCSFSEYMIY